MLYTQLLFFSVDVELVVVAVQVEDVEIEEAVEIVALKDRVMAPVAQRRNVADMTSPRTQECSYSKEGKSRATTISL